ncbi:hypothetical protein [Streptomyces sp. NPDC014623]|uniref:hypothetical protein n=1 Tax=Streptomyces sp. NPDC014623 TaxID=3364875 RepID=UPI0036F9BA2E
MGIPDTSIAAIAALFSGVAAFGSFKTAAQANRTAEAANQTAASVAQIERDRWHQDLTPIVAFKLTHERGSVELLIRFQGPSSIGRLDRLDLTIRDDRDRTNDAVLAGGLSAEERDNTIWGPYRFRFPANGDSIGRTTAPIALDAGEEFRVGLDPSYPHSHYGGGLQQWSTDYQPSHLRLWVRCEVEGHKPWKLRADVPRPLDSTHTPWLTAH